MSEESPKSAVSPTEDTIIGETPAVFANKMYVTPNPYGTKLTFAEAFPVGADQQVKTRFSVYLVPNDLRALYQLIEPIVQNMQVVRADGKDAAEDG